jgi:hypothetical protein
MQILIEKIKLSSAIYSRYFITLRYPFAFEFQYSIPDFKT